MAKKQAKAQKPQQPKHAINPLIDCVFKALLGNKNHIALLINFLNSVLEKDQVNPIVSVTILNPYNEREFITDKLSIVDIKAEDNQGKVYQIEVQLEVYPSLAKRIIHTVSDIYQSQLGKSDKFSKLKPVISIWLLKKSLIDIKESVRCHHRFQYYDKDNHVRLSDDVTIHVLELGKWKTKETLKTKEDAWLYFFKEGERLSKDGLPSFLDNPIMREAMSVLHDFSDKQESYSLYKNRLNFIREQLTIQDDMEMLKETAEKERKEKEKERKEKEKANKEKEKERKEKEKANKKAEKANKEKEKANQEKEKANQEKEKAEKRAKNAESILKKERKEKENLLKRLKEAGINPED